MKVKPIQPDCLRAFGKESRPTPYSRQQRIWQPSSAWNLVIRSHHYSTEPFRLGQPCEEALARRMFIRLATACTGQTLIGCVYLGCCCIDDSRPPVKGKLGMPIIRQYKTCAPDLNERHIASCALLQMALVDAACSAVVRSAAARHPRILRPIRNGPCPS